MRRLSVAALLSLCTASCVLPSGSTDAEPQAQGAQLANVRGQTLSDQCRNGGVDIELGIDENADGQLAADEVDRVVTVCNGEDGAEGSPGETGRAGADGDAGPQGPPGADGTSCTVVDNGDGTKTIRCGDTSVVVTDGVDGADGAVGPAGPTSDAAGPQGPAGDTALVRTTAEPEGNNCTSGGIAVEIGIDANGNGVLDDSEVEVSRTTYVCNGENAAAPPCGVVEGSVTIRNALELQALAGCTGVGGDLDIRAPGLTSIAGLSSLTSVGGNLIISGNNTLTSLGGLDNVTSVGGDLHVVQNDSLTSLYGLDNVRSVGASVQITENRALTTIAALSTSILISGDVQFRHNYNLRQCDIEEWLTAVSKTCSAPCDHNRVCGPDCSGNFDGDGVPNLDFLQECTSISGNLDIAGNPTLRSLSGLEGLASVGGNLSLKGNPLLASLSSLESLTMVGGNLEISSSNSLASLSGLDALASVEGDLSLQGNLLLANLSGFEALSMVGGNLNIWSSPALTSLRGLEGLTSLGAYLNIFSNGSLPPCEVAALETQVPDTCNSCFDNAGSGSCLCGDNNQNLGEGCDDGNLTPDDGCSDTCTVE